MIHQHRNMLGGNLVLLILAALGLLIANPIHAQTTSNTTDNELEEDWMDCPLCADPTHFPLDPLSRFVSGAETWTCQSAFELEDLTLPSDNCTFWQSRGEVICQCAEGPPEVNECTLCEDGSALPNPLLAAIPGKICAQLQVDAKRDQAEFCIAYQQTIGVYCGCDNPLATAAGQEVCRLCGDTSGDTTQIMADSMKMVSLMADNGNTVEASCGQLEFSANLPGEDCSDFQLLYSESCCVEAPTPSPSPEDGAPLVVASSWLGLSLLMLLAGLFVVH
jgi:hypothetical protein